MTYYELNTILADTLLVCSRKLQDDMGEFEVELENGFIQRLCDTVSEMIEEREKGD